MNKEFDLKKNTGLSAENFLRAELKRMSKDVNDSIIYTGGARSIITEKTTELNVRSDALVQSIVLLFSIDALVLKMNYANPINGALISLIYKGAGELDWQGIIKPLEGISSAFKRQDILIFKDEEGFKYQLL